MNRKNYSLVLLALSLCGCSKHGSEPQTETTDTKIVFDWSQKSEEDAISAGMTLLIYPNDGGAMIQQKAAADEETIALPAGDYRVIAISDDCPTTELRNQDRYETAEIYVSTATTRADDVLSKISLPHYAAVKGSSISVKAGGVDNTFKLLLQSIVKKVKFEVITELDKEIQDCSGVLTGISPAVNLSTLEPLRDNPGQVMIDFNLSPKEVTGETVVFGVNPDIEGAEKISNKLLLNFRFTDGSEVVVPIDVSEAMNETVEDKITVSIKIQTSNELTLIGQVVKWETGGEVKVPVGH